MLPVGQEGPQGGDDQQGLVQHHVVASQRDLDYRCHLTQLLVHVGADVGGDEAVFGPEQGDAAGHLSEKLVGSGARRQEDAGIELPGDTPSTSMRELAAMWAIT